MSLPSSRSNNTLTSVYTFDSRRGDRLGKTQGVDTLCLAPLVISANIASRYFFYIAAGFFRFDSAMIMIRLSLQ